MNTTTITISQGLFALIIALAIWSLYIMAISLSGKWFLVRQGWTTNRLAEEGEWPYHFVLYSRKFRLISFQEELVVTACALQYLTEPALHVIRVFTEKEDDPPILEAIICTGIPEHSLIAAAQMIAKKRGLKLVAPKKDLFSTSRSFTNEDWTIPPKTKKFLRVSTQSEQCVATVDWKTIDDKLAGKTYLEILDDGSTLVTFGSSDFFGAIWGHWNKLCFANQWEAEDLFDPLEGYKYHVMKVNPATVFAVLQESTESTKFQAVYEVAPPKP